jgi:hypothetical protein
MKDSSMRAKTFKDELYKDIRYLLKMFMIFERQNMSLKDNVPYSSKTQCLYVFRIFMSFQRCQRRPKTNGHFPDVAAKKRNL